jgi:hypothetical protein
MTTPSDVKVVNDKLDELSAAVNKIVVVLEGGHGMPGIVQLLRDHDEQLKTIAQEKSYQKGVLAVLSFMFGAFGASVASWFKGSP